MLLARLASLCVLRHGLGRYSAGFVPKLFPSSAPVQTLELGT